MVYTRIRRFTIKYAEEHSFLGSQLEQKDLLGGRAVAQLLRVRQLWNRDSVDTDTLKNNF